ncbi:MAG: cyclodeaminase/cyclohydrolase family protein [Candidatus Omnitrophota bacterium]|nr:cyclodeaminase/cyclohydrolase family protein [Candidatus Omnitrophota bacterium]MDZ4242960.1 cyclodeaminase/cyclohydrolase family protein [Candidatus Omnitrophota bacterium]
MKKFKNHTVQKYLDVLSQKAPIPGGGSAAALTAAVGTALISMSANYSKGRSPSAAVERKIRRVLARSEKIRKRLMEDVDRDAQAYLKVVRTRKSSPAVRRAALKQAGEVPLDVCRLCYQAMDLTPDLVRYGNPHLLSDVEVAVELLSAAFKSAMINVKVNQQ